VEMKKEIKRYLVSLSKETVKKEAGDLAFWFLRVEQCSSVGQPISYSA
jgi:hypothetical protein